MTRTTMRRAALWGTFVVALLYAALTGCNAWEGRLRDEEVRRLEAVIGPLDAATLNRPEVEDYENQTKLYRAAAEAMGLTAKETRLLRYLSSNDSDPGWSRDEAEVRALLEKNRLPLELLFEGCRRPRWNWGIAYERLHDARLPNLAGLMKLSRLNVVAATIDLHDGKTGAAMVKIHSGLTLAASMLDEPALIVRLVGDSIEASHVKILRRLLSAAELEAGDLRRLESLLVRFTEQSPIRDGLIGETKSMHQVLRRMEGDTLGSLHYSVEPTSEKWSRAARWFTEPIIRKGDRIFLNGQAATLERAAIPRFRRPPAPTEVSGRVAAWIHSSFGVSADVEVLLLRGDLHIARVDLARIGIALRLRRLETGVYPERLAELTPAPITEIPADPFSGSQYEYRKEGSGFLLSSAGKDGRLLPYDEGQYQALEWRITR